MREEKFLSGKRILIIEDIAVIALDLAGFVEDLGGEAIGPATTVNEALALIDEARPDGALLDINLGGDPGYPVAEELTRRRLPFVFMTGYDALPESYARFPFVTKPFDYHEVRRLLRAVFAEDEINQAAL